MWQCGILAPKGGRMTIAVWAEHRNFVGLMPLRSTKATSLGLQSKYIEASRSHVAHSVYLGHEDSKDQRSLFPFSWTLDPYRRCRAPSSPEQYHFTDFTPRRRSFVVHRQHTMADFWGSVIPGRNRGLEERYQSGSTDLNLLLDVTRP